MLLQVDSLDGSGNRRRSENGLTSHGMQETVSSMNHVFEPSLFPVATEYLIEWDQFLPVIGKDFR